MSDSLQPRGLEPTDGILQARIMSVLPFPPPGDLSNPRIKRTSLTSPALAGKFWLISMIVYQLRWLFTKDELIFLKITNNIYPMLHFKISYSRMHLTYEINCIIVFCFDLIFLHDIQTQFLNSYVMKLHFNSQLVSLEHN